MYQKKVRYRNVPFWGLKKVRCDFFKKRYIVPFLRLKCSFYVLGKIWAYKAYIFAVVCMCFLCWTKLVFVFFVNGVGWGWSINFDSCFLHLFSERLMFCDGVSLSRTCKLPPGLWCSAGFAAPSGTLHRLVELLPVAITVTYFSEFLIFRISELL